MFLSRIGRKLTSVVTVAGLSIALVSLLSAQAPTVTYNASGTFGYPAVSGADTLELAGEPFNISIPASAASVPIQYGGNWAIFSPLHMTGEVHSGLLGSTPVEIASGAASIELAWGPYDIFQTGFPVKVVGISLTVRAYITMPAGTITNQLVHPFSAVALTPSNSTVTYSQGTESTTLTVSTGTLMATIPYGSRLPALRIPEQRSHRPVVRIAGSSQPH